MTATTIEQSKKLIELGLSADTADMTWEKVAKCLTEDFYWKLIIGLDKAIKDNLFSYRNGHVLPCWSLSKLIELMPDKICIDNENYHINFNKKEVAYKGRITWEGQLGITIIDDNLINAVFKMICYLLENKLCIK